MTAVTAGFVAQRNQHCAALWHALDFALQDPELRGVDHIVGGIDGEEWRVDFFEVGARIVIVRRFDRIKHIIRVAGFQVVGNEFVQHLVGFRECRRFFLPQDRIAAHKPKHLRSGAQARRLRFVIAAAPIRIVADRVDDHATPGAVASGNLCRQSRQGHERVHEIRMRFAPQPGVHSAH